MRNKDGFDCSITDGNILNIYFPIINDGLIAYTQTLAISLSKLFSVFYPIEIEIPSERLEILY